MMWIGFILWSAQSLFLNVPMADHDLHVSVTEIQKSKKTGEVEVSIRVFLDDLQLALKTENDLEDLVDVDEKKLINNYIGNHFSVTINGESYPMILEQIIPSNPAVFCILQLEGAKTKAGDEIYIKNDLFMEVYDDQINMINVRLDRRPRSYSLNKNERDHSFVAK